MIKTVSELLQQLIEKEKIEIEAQGIKHAPTIGEMYEGLTSKILNKTFPEELELKVVSGFITNSIGDISGQIDCMLVKGNGIPIVNTNKYKWDILDVICVIEVKKNLLKSELIDSYEHLKKVNHLLIRELTHSKDKSRTSFELEHVKTAFEKITGYKAPNYDKIYTLLFEHQSMYHTLVMEYILPIRIVIGYEGFKTESGLRNSFQNYLYSQASVKGFSPICFPSLIISDRFSLLKANGYPYIGTFSNNDWNFLLSTRSNPLALILELIWTRLEQAYPYRFFNDDLELETFSLFLSASPIRVGDKKGWEYDYKELQEEALKKKGSTAHWKPYLIFSE